MTRVALDLLGGDHAPGAVVDGALLVRAETPDVEVVLVGPPDVAAALLAERDATGAFEVVAATQVVGMDEDPARAVRSKRDATVRVACRLVRDGSADAVVSVGSTGAALAAGLFTLGRQKGMSRPALAAVIPSASGPLVLLDAGANPDGSTALLAQLALAGVAFAQASLGIERPRVGLLSIGSEAGKGDQLRKASYDVLAGLPVEFVGCVEGGDVPHGGVADVVVTDGFTGNVLIKGLEGAASMLREAAAAHLRATGHGDAVEPMLDVTDGMLPDALGGAVLLGVQGVCVIGHGASTPRAVASCVAVAVRAVREGLVDRVGAALAAHAAAAPVEVPA